MRKPLERAGEQRVTPDPGTPGLRERKLRAVREAIWTAAMDLFAASGYDKTTVEDIAQAAGISLRSFFRYFMSKGDLMSFALVLYGEQLAAAIDACPANHSLREVFRESISKVANAGLSNESRTRRHLDILRLSAAAAAAEMSRLSEVQARVADAYERRLPPAPESTLTARVMAALSIQTTGVAVRWCLDRGEPNAANAMNYVISGMESAFCAKKPRRN